MPQVAGTVYFGACVNPVPEETDKTNNCSPGVAVTTKRSDLVVRPPSVSKSNLDAREQFTLNAPATPGTYYYGACMDPALQTPPPLVYAAESNTSNNCSRSVTVVVNDVRDLRVWNIQIPHGGSPPGAGERFVLSVFVLNNSRTFTSPATKLRWYRSTDATITTSDTQQGTMDVDSLGPGNAVVRTFELTAPTNAGTYYYGACADLIPNESDSTNNCSSGFKVVIE